MEQLDQLKVPEEQLASLPMFFRKMYSNVIVDIDVEDRICKYNAAIQSDKMREIAPVKPISKVYVMAAGEDAAGEVMAGDVSEREMILSTDKKYFVLSNQCRLVIGASRSLITDYSRVRLFSISNTYSNLLRAMDRAMLSDIREGIEEGSQQDMDKFLGFLLKNELGFLCEDASSFPKASNEWSHPNKVINAILDFRRPFYDARKAIGDLDRLNCKNIQIRIFCAIEDHEIEELLATIKNTNMAFAELYLPYSEERTNDDLNRLLYDYHFLSKIYVFNAPEEDTRVLSMGKEGCFPLEVGSVCYITPDLASEKSCGIVCHDNMNYSSLELYNEMQHYNGCLNRKISVSSCGQIKNCPSMAASYGHIDETSLLDVVERLAFRKYFTMKKDDIAVCKDCEYRYNCTDCRAYLEDPEDALSKPLKCGYDPYTNKWEDWSLNPLKERAMEFYGI